VIDGSFIENFVYTCLKNHGTLKYYRTISGVEIDFIIEKENELVPIEVKFRNQIRNIPVAVANFENRYKKHVKKQIIITKNELSKQ